MNRAAQTIEDYLIVMTRALRLLASAALIIAMPAAPAFAQEADRSFQFAAPADAPQTFADLIATVSPAVVSIEASGTVEPGDAPDLSQVPPQFRDFFERFGGGPQQPRERRSQGSGFFISADGFLVTNNHVIDEAQDITVALSDGRRLAAEIIGTDPATDLAVLRVNEGAPFDFVTLDPNTDVRVGDWVVAVGNPFGLGGTATTGIISATGRQVGPGQAYTDFIQTDAAINRGNSGGPMFDLNGHVIGVNSAIISPTGGNVGIGFAIPSDLAANVVNQLIEAGEVQRGYLGVQPADLTEDLKAAMGLDEALDGVLINQVLPGTPAEAAGLENGDVITEVNGETIDGALELTRRVGAFQPGEDVRFTVMRDAEELNFTVVLAERPQADDEETEPPVQAGQVRMFGMTLEAPSEADRERLGLEQRGLLITNVEPGSESARKGMRVGDAILEAGGRDVATAADFQDAVEDAIARDRKALLVFVASQGGQRRYAALEIETEE